MVANSRSYLNSANGIFIGFDAVKDHVIRDCVLYRNRQSGILRGASKSDRAVLERNREFENRGLPPDQSALLAAQARRARRAGKADVPRPEPEGGERRGEPRGGDELPLWDALRSCVSDREEQKFCKRCGTEKSRQEGPFVCAVHQFRDTA